MQGDKRPEHQRCGMVNLSVQGEKPVIHAIAESENTKGANG